MKEHQDSDYTFLQEKIKERPINKKKLIRSTINTATFAVVFGLVACVSFILLEPVISNWLNPQEEQVEINSVILPAEDDEMLPEDMVEDEAELDLTENINISSAVTTVELQLSDYEKMYDELYDVVEETQKSMVTVIGMSSNVDWFNNTLESENETTGFIITDNNKELLILADYKYVKDATEIKVIFVDNMQVVATVKKYDPNTGLAIIAVELANIPKATMEDIEHVKLGSSNSGNYAGDLVIAVGSPLGYTDSLCYGNITSIGKEINTIDRNYKLITTDIYGSSSASGALFNTSGQLIGIINQNYNSTDLENQISAIGISELRKLIENLSNAKDTNHLGLFVTDVTDSARQQLSMPMGVYVLNVDPNSPAMLTGIQKGDIVTAVDDVLVRNVTDYVAELRSQTPGEEIMVTIQRMSVDGYREIDVKVTLEILD